MQEQRISALTLLARPNVSFNPTYLDLTYLRSGERVRVIKGLAESSNNEKAALCSCSIVAICIRIALPTADGSARPRRLPLGTLIGDIKIRERR